MTLQIAPELNRSQAAFLELESRFAAFVGGFGSGKTWAGCAAICKSAWEYPGSGWAYLAPSYPLIADVFYPTMDECAASWGLSCTIQTSAKRVKLFSRGVQRDEIICRSMDRPESIVGFEVGSALIDELDVMPREKQRTAWRKIIARTRSRGAGNRVLVTTTPEGFRFTYERFVKSIADNPALRESYQVVHASTYENRAFLPEGYIESLEADYPQELINAYLHGRFVNLTSGTVYNQFDRAQCGSNETASDAEQLHVGVDFNVGKSMASTVAVKRGETSHVVAEVLGAGDTPSLIAAIRNRYPSNPIAAYPDASGSARSTINASLTDIALLEQAGFAVITGASNPRVRDRVNSVNSALRAGRLRINCTAAPTVAENLERQAYDATGAPDKSHGADHTNDCVGYYVWQTMPIQRPVPVITGAIRFAT